MRTKLTRIVAGAAVLATAAVGLISTNASALPAGTAPTAGQTMTPLAGTSTTVFTLGLTAPNNVCPGDTASGGYQWTTYMVPSSVDVATLTYDGAGFPIDPGAGFAQPLFSNGGSPVVANNTAVTTGLVTGIPTMSFGVFPAGFVTAGNYKVGFACVLAGATARYWSTTIAVDAAGSYTVQVLPSAPTLNAPLTAGAGTLSGTFAAPVASPAATGYAVTATPTSGPVVSLTVPAPATTFSLTGLVNGVSYSVTVATINSVGTGPASNAVSGTPVDVNARPPVVLTTTALGAASATINWIAPAIAPDAAPFYDVAVTPAAGVTIGAVTAGSTSVTLGALTAGTSYTVDITPVYAAPAYSTPASLTFVALGDSLIIQDIAVTRPAGALVLTQVCGVYGALDLEPASPGFGALAAKGATVAAGGQTGPTLGANGAGGVDPNYTNGLYPSYSPATYPTHCGIDLGTASLVTSGAEAGQYYAAAGQINQVTVSDTRDGQNGWTLNGTMSDFVNSTNSSVTFGGNWMGWTPKVNGFSAGQVVTAGSALLPNNPGLAAPATLASATTASLGVAQMDARLRLLIPVTVPSGTYNATLTFSVV